MNQFEVSKLLKERDELLARRALREKELGKTAKSCRVGGEEEIINRFNTGDENTSLPGNLILLLGWLSD